MGCLCCKVTTETIVIEEREKETPKPTPPPKKKPSPRRPPSPPEPPPKTVLAAKRIQTWWRSKLVQRTLLHSALCACIIQRWWRKTMAEQLDKRRRVALEWMAKETRACVTLQSWVRMLFTRQEYYRLINAVRIIQVFWRWHNCHTRGFFQGSYEVTENQLRLHLDIFLGSQICRISDCIPFSLKN